MAPEGAKTLAPYSSTATSLPFNFLRACPSPSKALARYQQTLSWRETNHIDSLLFHPNTTLETIRKYYPHFLHGRGKQGEIIMYEMAGRMDMGGLKATENYTADDLAKHSTYMQEFMWRVLAPEGQGGREGGEGKMVTVMDLACMSLRRLGSSDTSELIKATSNVLNTHYPERVSRILGTFLLRSLPPSLFPLLPSSLSALFQP